MLVGEDPASAVYVAGKQRACEEVGMRAFDVRLSADATQAEVRRRCWNASARTARERHPAAAAAVPDQLDGDALTALIAPAKDVDGLTPRTPACSRSGARAFGRARRPA